MSTLIQLPAEAEAVLAAIRRAGGWPLLAGGCVRDALLGLPLGHDIDVEVYGIASLKELRAALAGTGIVTEAGKAFTVLKVWAGTVELDISLPRRDSKTGKGHKGFEVTADAELSLADASARRDLTVNSMMHDTVTGKVFDCHDGLADLRAGILRHTSAAFPEDPLRVLRLMRFAARFGFTVAPKTVTLCRSVLSTYRELPVERVWVEWYRMLTECDHLSAGLAVLAETHWVHHYPELAVTRGIPQDPRWHPEGDVWTHLGLAADQAARLAGEAGLTGDYRFVVVAAALLHDLGKPSCTKHEDDGTITSYGHAEAGVRPAAAFLNAIGCRADLTARILPLIAEHMNCLGTPTRPAVRRLARRLAPHATLYQLTMTCGADNAGRGDPGAPNPAAAWLAMGRDLQAEKGPVKGLLDGDDLIAAGLVPGPGFGPILKAALAAQDDGEFSDKAGALEWLAAYRKREGGELTGVR